MGMPVSASRIRNVVRVRRSRFRWWHYVASKDIPLPGGAQGWMRQQLASSETLRSRHLYEWLPTSTFLRVNASQYQ
jgi:hypothetical protein